VIDDIDDTTTPISEAVNRLVHEYRYRCYRRRTPHAAFSIDRAGRSMGRGALPEIKA
jgi:hypothetical protein